MLQNSQVIHADPYLLVSGNGGCYNDTDLPAKPLTGS